METGSRTVRIAKVVGKKGKRKRTSGKADDVPKDPEGRIEFSKRRVRRRPGDRGGGHVNQDARESPEPPSPAAASSSAGKKASSRSGPSQQPSKPVAVRTVTKWGADSGDVASADVDIFVDMFNLLSLNLGRRLLFLRSPDSDLINEVNRQWPHVSFHCIQMRRPFSYLPMQVSALATGSGDDISLEDPRLRYVHHSKVNAYDAVVFVHLDAKKQTWSLLEYNVNVDRSQAIFAVKPSGGNISVDAHDVCRTGEFFRKDRSMKNVSRSESSALP